MAIPPPESGYAFPGMENLHKDIYPAISASSNPSLQQPGKVVLVTGAGRGIGRAMALQYAHASVAGIIICARTTSQLDEVEASIKKISGDVKVKKVTIDVTNDAAVAKLSEEVKREFGRLDVLVNNAGGSAEWSPIADSKPEEWWNTMAVNLKGPYLFMQAFLPLMVETAKTHGTLTDLVNVTSIGANMVFPTASAYQVSKLALQRLTEFVDAEYGDKGIIATGLHPGGVLTELSKDNTPLLPCKSSRFQIE